MVYLQHRRFLPENHPLRKNHSLIWNIFTNKVKGQNRKSTKIFMDRAAYAPAPTCHCITMAIGALPLQ